MLSLSPKQKNSLLDFYLQYLQHLQQSLPEKKVKKEIAKVQTGWVRYTLIGFGFQYPNRNRLTSSSIQSAYEFMSGLPLDIAASALEAQQRGFDEYGDSISSSVRRVYRSAVKKSLDWLQKQSIWRTSCDSEQMGEPPRILFSRERYSLKPTKYSPLLQKEIKHLCQCWQSDEFRLSDKTVHRYCEDINSLLGWLHIYKGEPLETLSLLRLVPLKALTDPTALQTVVDLVREHLDWLRLERRASDRTLQFRLDGFVHVVEYAHHIHLRVPFQRSAKLTEQPLIQALKGLKEELGIQCDPKTTDRKRRSPYALRTDQISAELREEMDRFLDFLIDGDFYQESAVVMETAMMRVNHVYRVLGYCHNVLNLPSNGLNLQFLVSFAPAKTAARRAIDFGDIYQMEQQQEEAAEETLKRLQRYILWLRKQRKISAGTEVLVIEAFIAVAKFLYQNETNKLKAKNYEDILVITALRREFAKAKQRAKDAPSNIDESLKWLDWPDFLAMVRQLEQECRPSYKGGTLRSKKATGLSVQRFLIAAFLAYMPPDRQRTLRELEEGKTLVRGQLHQDGNRVWLEPKENGLWYIHLPKGSYKTSKTYGEQWHPIPEILYPYIHAWRTQWREVFQPNHRFFFTQKNGQPFSTANSFLSVFKRAAYRITGKATTPHMVRHMIITYLKRQGVDHEVMHSLADAMHHSVKIQQQIYDRRHPVERSTRAQQVMLNLAQGGKLSGNSNQSTTNAESIWNAIQQLNCIEQEVLLERLRSLQENSISITGNEGEEKIFLYLSSASTS